MCSKAKHTGVKPLAACKWFQRSSCASWERAPAATTALGQKGLEKQSQQTPSSLSSFALGSRNSWAFLPSRLHTPWCSRLFAPACVIVKLLMRTRLGTGGCYYGIASQHEALHDGLWLRGSSFVHACWHQHCWQYWSAGIDVHDTVGIDVNDTVRVLALMLLLPLALMIFISGWHQEF